MVSLNLGHVEGLPEEEQKKLNNLVNIYNYHAARNDTKRRYYNGHIKLSEVNLGIALPVSFSKLDIGCSWGAKTVDVLAARSMFDGFVSENGAEAETMTDIVKRNRMIAEYQKACRDELLYGSSFAVLSGEPENATIRFYSPQCAAASWSAEKGRIDYGFAFQDSRDDESDINWKPMYINYFTDDATWVLSRESGHWAAEEHPHKFERPMMIALTWNPSSDKPFGQSRIKYPIRKLIQGYVRTIADATIGLEFATSPQKYLLGVTDDQYDAIIDSKFKQYVGSIIASTSNPETGQNPTFGQLQQGNIEPHVQMIRLLATQFSAATGLPITDTGVINDANPTSSDAILAQTQTLVTMAEQLNTSNGDSLKLIAQMAQAIELGTTLDALPDDNKNVIAHFKNPAMPSIASTADAATKIASSRENFASTDVYLEMVGFDQADIRRIKSQERNQMGMSLINMLESSQETNDNSSGLRRNNTDNGEGQEDTEPAADTETEE